MEKLQKIKSSVPFQRIDLATDYIQLNQRYLADFSTPEKRFTNQNRTFAGMKQRTEEDYYIESRRLREETMRMADELKDHPMRFIVTNVITMDVEITKSDLKTIVSKNTQNNRFNAFKKKVAQDIRGFLEKSKYEGWREVIPGKHPETAHKNRKNLLLFSFAQLQNLPPLLCSLILLFSENHIFLLVIKDKYVPLP